MFTRSVSSAPLSIMPLLPRFLCRLFGHRRSRHRAYLHPDERRWRSYCRHCGAPLRKDALLGWREA
jgi:hypothetical protein